ncbi:MAG TPA: MJ0042-type zinc finger domain-containing protein [Pseudolabrys sp.]|nr:MJ0042-type zinc finger domain-containing protein [Pseudolabrys sp.]
MTDEFSPKTVGPRQALKPAFYRIFTKAANRCRQKRPKNPTRKRRHGFRSINGRLLVLGIKIQRCHLLIACPDCATSYMIDPASLGPAGRTVRCARCRTTWFAEANPQFAPAGEDERIGIIRPDRPHSAGASIEAAQSEPRSGVDEAIPSAEADSTLPELPTTIADAPSIVPAQDNLESAEGLAAPAGADEIENFTARRKRLQAKRKKARRSSRWTALILVLFAFNIVLVGARGEIVRFFPQTASLFSAVGLPVNLRHLKFENMRISKESQEGVSSLVIEGTIVNIASKPTELPRLRFAARDSSGQEIYTWSALPSRSILGPGEKLDFRSRFVSPPPNAVDVMVRFFTPKDTDIK